MARGRKPKTLVDYVKNADLLEALILFKESNYKDVKLEDKLARMYMKIAKKILNAPNWFNYDIMRKQDMYSEAVYIMFTKTNKFNSEISKNPFAYFSECALNVYRQYAKDHKKKDDLIANIGYVQNLEDVVDLNNDE